MIWHKQMSAYQKLFKKTTTYLTIYHKTQYTGEDPIVPSFSLARAALPSLLFKL
jgi:hypothetical protein